MQIRATIAALATLAILVSGCLSPSLIEEKPEAPTGPPAFKQFGAPAQPLVPSPPPAPAVAPVLEAPAPGFVNIFVIEATLNITRDDNLSADLGVDLIFVPHCTFVNLDENNTKLVVRRPFDLNVTAVILVHYIDRTSFSGGGDDTAVFFLKQDTNASVPSALNRSTPLYSFSPAASAFSPSRSSTNLTVNSLESTYDVQGALTLYPDFYPKQTGVFRVGEWHTLVTQFTAELDLQRNGFCD